MSDELINRVCQVISNVKHIPLEKISIESAFQDIGVDSMDAVEILFGLENEFDITIPDEEAKNVRTVRDMAEGVEKLLAAKSADATAGQ